MLLLDQWCQKTLQTSQKINCTFWTLACTPWNWSGPFLVVVVSLLLFTLLNSLSPLLLFLFQLCWRALFFWMCIVIILIAAFFLHSFPFLFFFLNFYKFSHIQKEGGSESGRTHFKYPPSNSIFSSIFTFLFFLSSFTRYTFLFTINNIDEIRYYWSNDKQNLI